MKEEMVRAAIQRRKKIKCGLRFMRALLLMKCFLRFIAFLPFRSDGWTLPAEFVKQ